MAQNTTDSNPPTSYGGSVRIPIGNIGGNATRTNRTSSRTTDSETENEQVTAGSGETVRIPIGVQTQPTRRGRKPQVDATVLNEASDVIVGVIQTIGTFRYGPSAVMTKTEHDMMVKGAVGSLKSLPPTATKQISAVSAPLMFGMGFFFYLARLSQLEEQRKANMAERSRAVSADAVLEAQQILQTHQNGNMDIPSKDALMDQMGGT